MVTQSWIANWASEPELSLGTTDLHLSEGTEKVWKRSQAWGRAGARVIAGRNCSWYGGDASEQALLGVCLLLVWLTEEEAHCIGDGFVQGVA